MQYTVNKLEGGKVELKVDVPKAGFEAAYHETLTSYAQKTNVAGFRPGMAPVDIVEGQVGSNKILNETASFLIAKHVSAILKKEDLVPIDSPKIAIESLTHGSPFSFIASFTLRPKVTVGDWKKIRVKKLDAKEVTNSDVEDSIKNIFDAWSKQKETKAAEVSSSFAKASEDRKVSNEEEIVIYDAKGNRIPIKDSKTLDESNIIDDNFAKAIGASDLEHLKEIVKKDLETVVADQVEAKLEQEIFEEILKVSDCVVPDVLMGDELNRILLRLTNQLEEQGKDLNWYLAEQKTTIDELKAKWSQQGEVNVKTTLVMDQIGRDEKIVVSKEEIEQAFKGVNETNLSAAQRADLERYIALSIFQVKTLDLVKKAIAS